MTKQVTEDTFYAKDSFLTVFFATVKTQQIGEAMALVCANRNQISTSKNKEVFL